MNLDINRKKIDTGPIKQLMIQGEIDADVITFKLPSEYDGMDITGLTYVLRAVSRKETMTEQALLKSVEGDFLYLTWTVTADFTAVSGEIQLELRGFDEEESIVIKFTGDPVFVAPEIGGEQIPEPAAINAAIDQLQILVSNFVNETLPAAEAAAEAATTAAVNPAYIGENGNWFTFDAELDEYVDSGVAAQGPEGPEGPAGGPPGPEGPPGADGVGVPPGGSAGQVLTKASGGDFDTEWSDVPDTVEIVNNLTETIPGKVLDATQGKALGDIISTKASKTQESWIAPTLLNSWVNSGGGEATAAYYKDEFGVVHIKGRLKNGTYSDGTVLFALSAGYRPSELLTFNINNGSGAGIGLITINSINGNVTVYLLAGNTSLVLGNISFRV